MKSNWMHSFVIMVLAATTPAIAQHDHGQHGGEAGRSVTPNDSPDYTRMDAYPLEVCVVTGEELSGDKVQTFDVQGRTFRTCCGKCRRKVEAAPASFSATLDAEIVARQSPSYPLDICVISGKALGGMGPPVSIVIDGVLIKLCCKGCRSKALARGSAATRMVIDAAYASQVSTYPLATCMVSGDTLGDDRVDVMYGLTLVRLGGEACVDRFRAAPDAVLAQLAAARLAASGQASEDRIEDGDATTKGDGKDGGHDHAHRRK